MKIVKKIDTTKNLVWLEDFTIKLIDNYLLELEDKLLQIEDIVNGYVPNKKDMDKALNDIQNIIENRK